MIIRDPWATLHEESWDYTRIIQASWFKVIIISSTWFLNVLIVFLLSSPLLEWIQIPITIECFVSSLVEIGQVVLKKMFFINIFLLFHYYLSLEKHVALHLNKLEFRSPKNALCEVWLKLAKWFERWRFSNIVNVFLLFCYNLPLEKSMAL